MKITYTADEVRAIIETHVLEEMNMWRVAEVQLHTGGGASIEIPPHDKEEGAEPALLLDPEDAA